MIEDFDLHDATLVAVHLTWADGTCVMMIRHSQLSDCTLTFNGVSNLVLPRTQPWGPSRSINSISQQIKGQYVIEMQSGDMIRIEAGDAKLVPLVLASSTGTSSSMDDTHTSVIHDHTNNC
jgi:DNA polymerase I-like protein with 3'-5' exonuclease and polymerase domains